MIVKKILVKIYQLINKWKNYFILNVANIFNTVGNNNIIISRKINRYLNISFLKNEVYNIEEYKQLHKDIKYILKEQKKKYKNYQYYMGNLYQGLDILNIYGQRNTEIRFNEYMFYKYIDRSDTILDIGANAGFMSIYTVYRTGCTADAIEHNPYMVQIGEIVSKYLYIEKNINIICEDFKTFTSKKQYSIIFSFATHWTDDSGYRVSLNKHLNRLHSFLENNGVLFFETHSADVGNEEFYFNLNKSSNIFFIEEKITLDNNTRELYIMRKI